MLGKSSHHGDHHPPLCSPTPSPTPSYCISCNPPSIPVWPDKVMIFGDEYVLSSDGIFPTNVGTFLTEYDWTDGNLRESHVNIPGGSSPGQFERFFNIGPDGWDAYYNLTDNSWICYFIPDLPMAPPNYLNTTCMLASNVVDNINNQWCYQWYCPYGTINQTVWTNCQTGIIVRQYQPPIDIYPALRVDFNSFIDGTTVFADGLFPRVPIVIDSIFGCPNTRRDTTDKIDGAKINLLFRDPSKLFSN